MAYGSSPLPRLKRRSGARDGAHARGSKFKKDRWPGPLRVGTAPDFCAGTSNLQ